MRVRVALVGDVSGGRDVEVIERPSLLMVYVPKWEFVPCSADCPGTGGGAHENSLRRPPLGEPSL
jgi:hypothetical protein